MSDMSSWKQSAMSAGLIVIAAAAYYVAQTAINAHRVKLPALEYLNCLQKLSHTDWGKYGITNPPSSSEVCQSMTGYRP